MNRSSEKELIAETLGVELPEMMLLVPDSELVNENSINRFDVPSQLNGW